MVIMILQKKSYSIFVISVLFFFMILSVNKCLYKSIIQSYFRINHKRPRDYDAGGGEPAESLNDLKLLFLWIANSEILTLGLYQGRHLLLGIEKSGVWLSHPEINSYFSDMKLLHFYIFLQLLLL